jgi:hypothetical protein
MSHEDIKVGIEQQMQREIGEEALHMSGVAPAEQNSHTGEELASREPYFGPASLETATVYCGDKGSPFEQEGIYLHWFGGILKPVHDMTVMEEIYQPGSVTDTFEARAASLTETYTTIGKVKGGVHSDDVHEHGQAILTDQKDGDIGCKYAQLRPVISNIIHERGQEILDVIRRTQPHLLEGEHAQEFAQRALDAYGRLAQRESFYTSGRRVALAAVEHGAATQVLDRSTLTGQEDTIGIINKDPGTALNNTQANSAETPVPAYTHDDGALMQAHRNVSQLYPYDQREVELVSEIDTIGTFFGVGITADKIFLRQGQAA